MRIRRTVFASGACLLVVGVLVWAQGIRKPGLWEITTTTTWQKLPFPPGMQVPPSAAQAFGGAPRTSQVCLTQAWIDKFGAPLPQNRQCQATNVVLNATSMTADWVCTGPMAGKGTIESSWPDGEHAKGKMHFTGTMGGGEGAIPVEFTTESVSVYKGADCGSVKPVPLPPDK